jgi:hypothetical protein
MREEIDKQIAKADAVLEQLKSFGAVVAGGAPRDWYMSKPANDIDVFIAGQPSKEALSEALGLETCNMVELGEGHYAGRHERFVGFSFEDEDGQEFQILCHNKKSVEDIVKDFPNSLSMAIYYGKGRFWYDEWFKIGMDYGVGWYNDSSSYLNGAYENKIRTRFHWFRWSAHKDDILVYIGNAQEAEEEMMLDDF